MSSFPQLLPWLISLSFLVVLLIVLLQRLRSNQAQLALAQQQKGEHEQQVAVLNQKIDSLTEEQQRLAAAREELEQEVKTMSRQAGDLREELAALKNVASQLEGTTQELHTARKTIDQLRQEKSDLAAQLASLTSQLTEEKKASEEQLRLRAEAEEKNQAAMEKRLTEVMKERQNAMEQCDQLRQEYSDLRRDFAALTSQQEEERKAAAEKLALLEQAEKKLMGQFENLANRIFEEKQQKFSELSSQNMKAILAPMRQQLQEFRQKGDDVYDKENKERASLRTEIAQLKSLNERIGADALNLTKALKGDAKLRGNWGEMQLERLLEESGLEKGREYEVQVSLRDEEGSRLQPDVVVHLPEKKDVVIDAKVSLVAYEQYHGAGTEAERKKHLTSHIQSLRGHITSLSSKNYDDLVGVNSLDLVIMFVPIEPALLLALEHDPALFTDAFSRHILLVSPSTLMVTLQIIYNIWRYEYQNRNTLQIATDAGRLHDQFVLFVKALEDVGAKLEKATESYQLAHKRLTSGRGNLIKRTINLEKLGAKTKKKFDRQLLEEADT